MVRATYNKLNRHLTKIAGGLIRDMVYVAVFYINSFHAENGIYDNINPHFMMLEMKLRFYCHCLLEFVEYVQMRVDGGKFKDSRKLEALAVRPTGNYQVGHYFLNIQTEYFLT